MVTHQVNGMKYEKTPVRLSINRKKALRMTVKQFEHDNPGWTIHNGKKLALSPENQYITNKSTRDILWFLYKRHGTVVWQSVAGMLGVLLIVSWVS